MNKMLKIWGTTGLFLLFSASSACASWNIPADPALDAEITAHEAARNDLEQKIKEYNEKTKKKEAQAQSLLERITKLQQNSKLAQQQVELLELRLSKLRKSMGALTEETARVAQSMDGLVVELQSRLLKMYKYGSQEELNVLLTAGSTQEALVLDYLMGRLSRSDKLAVDGLLNKKTELEQARRELEKYKEQLAARSAELNAFREKYYASINATAAALSAVRRERRVSEAAVKELEQAQLDMGRTIIALMQGRRVRAADEREAGNVAPEKKGNYRYLDPGTLLEWPIKGQIIGYYGSRVHPVFKTRTFNPGIDVRAAAGAEVKAAGPGEVIFGGWLRGYGEVVIVDHGRDIVTVYAQLASTRVKEGSAVEAGTLVGTVGNTGASAGYSLHFEVRVRDAAKNPLEYLRRL